MTTPLCEQYVRRIFIVVPRSLKESVEISAALLSICITALFIQHLESANTMLQLRIFYKHFSLVNTNVRTTSESNRILPKHSAKKGSCKAVPMSSSCTAINIGT